MQIYKLRILIYLFLLTALFGGTKTITLKSGEKISGEVISEDDSSLVIRSATFGDITIKKSNILIKNMVITLESGDVVKGELVEQDDEKFVIKSAFGTLTIPSGEIVDITEQGSQTVAPVFTAVNKTVDDTWYFSRERLMDIWFDPTGFTMKKNTFYISGLSWGFSFNDNFQVSTRFFNYFWQDFNIRPKIRVFAKTQGDKQSSFSVGGHLHTRGLPDKYKWTNQDSDDFDNWERYGSEREVTTDQYGYPRYEEISLREADNLWYEVFAAYTVSQLRSGGNGRVNFTIGSSAVFYPGEDMAPRIYMGLDMDATKNFKLMTEMFYDPYYRTFADMGRSESKPSNMHFDIGFMTNKFPLFGVTNENFWVGYHFQRPWVSFYWKL